VCVPIISFNIFENLSNFQHFRRVTLVYHVTYYTQIFKTKIILFALKTSLFFYRRFDLIRSPSPLNFNFFINFHAYIFIDILLVAVLDIVYPVGGIKCLGPPLNTIQSILVHYKNIHLALTLRSSDRGYKRALFSTPEVRRREQKLLLIYVRCRHKYCALPCYTSSSFLD